MAKYIKLLAVLLAASGSIFASSFTLEGFFAISASGTFLKTSPSDNSTAPTIIDLSALGLVAGDVLQIQAQGTLCYDPSDCGYGPTFGAEFASGPGPLELADTSVLQRVPGLINYTAGGINSTLRAANNPNAYFGNLPTGGPGGPEDFEVDYWMNGNTGLVTVTIPANAQFLIIGVLDSYYGDNSGGNNLGILLSADSDPLPEPGSWAMLGLGLVAISLLRHKMVARAEAR